MDKRVYVIGWIFLVAFVALYFAFFNEYTGKVINGGKLSEANHEINIKDFEFSPNVLEVSIGETVAWVNFDSAKHSVTSFDYFFDSGDLEKGKVFSYTFLDAGIYDYYCKFHPEMIGTVIVGDNP